MPATRNGRGAQVILYGDARKAARGAMDTASAGESNTLRIEGVSGVPGIYGVSMNTFTPQILFPGAMQIGATPLALSAGQFGLPTLTSLVGVAAPGAGGGKITLACGTNAGTAKLIATAGTSTTAVTIVDNIGAGVAGC